MTDFSPENMAVANGPKPFAPRADDLTVPANRAPSGGSTSGSQDDGPAPVTTSPSPSPEIPTAMPEVKGRIEIHDEVVEKVAALAAMEVEGVADLGGDVARAIESVRERIGMGHKRGDQGIKAKVNGREVTIEVTIVIEYGHVVMEVARNVKYNVASQTSRMLGLKVVEVNVVVDDVRLPGEGKPEHDEDEAEVEVEEDGLVVGS